jgi:hypothetical protein
MKTDLGKKVQELTLHNGTIPPYIISSFLLELIFNGSKDFGPMFIQSEKRRKETIHVSYLLPRPLNLWGTIDSSEALTSY